MTISWFVLPLLALIFTHVPLYDNTRQIFFILPPVFLAAGMGMDFMFSRISRPIFQKILVALLILRALTSGFRLHPYEYVYYTSFSSNPATTFTLYFYP